MVSIVFYFPKVWFEHNGFSEEKVRQLAIKNEAYVARNHTSSTLVVRFHSLQNARNFLNDLIKEQEKIQTLSESLKNG